MTSLRDQLAKKRAHSTSLTIPLGEAGERAQAALTEAEQKRTAVGVLGNKYPDAVKNLDAEIKKKRMQLAKNSVTISFRGLTTEERDALVSAHPATDDMVKADKELPAEERRDINRATFLPAALAVCALDSDLTEEEWSAELGSDRWTAGEVNALFNAVVTATHAEPAAGIPKD